MSNERVDTGNDEVPMPVAVQEQEQAEMEPSISMSMPTMPVSKGIMITPPPPVMPPTPTSSPNTHGEWPNLNPNANPFQLSRDRSGTGEREHFALPHLPPLPLNVDYLPSLIHPSTLPSSSKSFKMRPRMKRLMYCSYNNILTESNNRKLRTAASTCNIELLNRILESGGNPNAADEYNRSPLHLAACRGYIPIVQQLLKFGANPNVIDSLGNTPLHLAVISASSNNFNVVVRVLLQGGASVHMFDRSGKSPLELAEAKLRLLRNRYDHPTPETAKILEDMCMLTTLILRYMVKQQRELEDLSALEKRLQNLSTSDDQEQVVSQTADELLASVERLSINNK
ncbi:ankyrin repeat domain-containing protein 54 [Drosophila sulfurigaster albostrigata]|uniref:Ankyrin repeat domain-containing protein 54 n=1 Tax=Drosophila albomicans TaxID=7291 RepID=A0A6P8WXT8_DROAB|nr:ankyrin repeat domain-containing protein 54 [Drosophila albomicans]XP_060660903.1 ankyrin repeat domain-containing protein 54 [Drosophila nasuta]XP_062130790.1 ankyrin repeat domain-containing protein 54 [Drosophila sulfurigaster albostrigata]